MQGLESRCTDVQYAHSPSHMQTREVLQCHCCDKKWWVIEDWCRVWMGFSVLQWRGGGADYTSSCSLCEAVCVRVASWELRAIHHVCLCSRALWHKCLPSACVSGLYVCYARAESCTTLFLLLLWGFVNGGLHHMEIPVSKSLCSTVR